MARVLWVFGFWYSPQSFCFNTALQINCLNPCLANDLCSLVTAVTERASLSGELARFALNIRSSRRHLFRQLSSDGPSGCALSRHALLHCSLDAVRLARLARPSASSHPSCLFPLAVRHSSLLACKKKRIMRWKREEKYLQNSKFADRGMVIRRWGCIFSARSTFHSTY